MKDEYDFTNAEQGKFYRPLEELDIPIYLDKELKAFFINKLRTENPQRSLSEVVNSLLKKNIKLADEN
jgi:hypothetical protein